MHFTAAIVRIARFLPSRSSAVFITLARLCSQSLFLGFRLRLNKTEVSCGDFRQLRVMFPYLHEKYVKIGVTPISIPNLDPEGFYRALQILSLQLARESTQIFLGIEVLKLNSNLHRRGYEAGMYFRYP